MGADGGICWINAPDPDGARHLLAPWIGSLTNFDGGTSWAEEANFKALADNVYPMLHGPYGTDRADGQTLGDLPDFLRHIRQALEAPSEALEKMPPSMTTLKR